MNYVLTYKNKAGEPRYYNLHASEEQWYDCAQLSIARIFHSESEANAMRDRLNKISRAHGWYGIYKTKRI